MSKTPVISFPDCSVSQVLQDKHSLRFIIESTYQSAPCPSCHQISKRIHSYYTRRLHDLPISEWRVYLEVEAKRFRCSNPTCPRKTFVEPLSELTRRYARRTQRLSRALWHLAQISGAQAGSDLAKQLKIMVARDTLLRLLRRDAVFVASQARMIGVDDWAKKRGQDYGSILVDLEAHRVIDLLPNRQADTLAAWLSQHPEIQLVTRDRSKEYAYGIQKGAPQAVQVADRWHLLKNISEMSERALLEIYPRLKKQPKIPVISAVPLRDAFPRSQKDLERKVLARQQRLQKYSQIQYLKARGYGQRQIARLLSLSRATVRAYYLAETFPERKVSYRPSQLDPYIPHLQQRWEEGCRKAQILWQEILELGYGGKQKQVIVGLRSYLDKRVQKIMETDPQCLP